MGFELDLRRCFNTQRDYVHMYLFLNKQVFALAKNNIVKQRNGYYFQKGLHLENFRVKEEYET